MNARFELSRPVSREYGNKVLKDLLAKLKASPFNNRKYTPPRKSNGKA